MAEYGQGVSEGAGRFSGSAGGGGSGGGDWGGDLAAMAGDAVDTLVALPTEQLVLLVAAILVGLFLLKRAF